MPPSGSGGKKSKNAPDEMTEIRFYVPGTVNRDRGSDAGSQKSDEEEEVSAAQAFHDSIKEKAEIGQVAGDIILSFEEVLVLTPRGRYDVDMFPDFLRLRGKTYDYKIMYTSISRLFLLPKDDQHVLFIVSTSLRLCNKISLSFLVACPQQPNPPRSDKISIPRHAVHQRRGNYCRTQYD